MAFQLGPYAPIRRHPNEFVDVILFLRQDKEYKVDSEHHEASIRRIPMPKPGLTLKIVDWSDWLTIFDTTDIFFTERAIGLLSLGKVVICVVVYLLGLAFVVYILIKCLEKCRTH